MTEIKAPLNLRIKNFILGHIHLFLVITFIALAVLFSSCGTAKAADYHIPDNAKDMFIADIESAGQSYSTFQSAYDDAFSYDYVTYVKNGSYFLWVFQRYEFAAIGVDTENGSTGYLYINNPDNNWGSAGLRSITDYFNMNNINNGDILQYVVEYDASGYFNFYGYYIDVNSVQTATWFTLAEYPSNSYTSVSGQYNASNPRLGLMSGRNFSNRDTFALSDIVTNHNFYTCNYSDGKCLLFTNNWEEVYPASVQDDRLKIYTINDNTGKDVVFDLDDFNFSNYDGSAAETQNTLKNNEIYVTVDYDGTEQVFTLDSTNSDILPAYLIETPLSLFNVDEYDNVKITKVSFSKLIHYRPSEMRPDETENFNIACEYYLKKYIEPIEKGENQYIDDVNGDPLTQSEIDDIYYTIHFSDGAGISFDDYELAPPEGYSVYTVYLKNTVSNWEDFIEDWEITIEEFYYLVLGSYNSQSAVEDYITEWIVANKAALYWDVIEFEWIQEDNSSLTRTYWYYTTESGRIRSISNVLADMYIQGNEIKVNSAAIFTSIDNFETESLEFFNAQLGFNSDAIEWFRTINNSVNSGFSSVVNAINNLDFSIPDYDDTDILDKLDDIITAISNIGTTENEIDTPQECIDFYIDNIDRDINDIDFELRPAYYEGMTLYILYSFDIDDNYSDDVQRSSMRSSKASNPITDSENILVKVIITLRDTFTSSDAHNVINSTLKDMNGRSDYYTLLFGTYYDCQEWEGWVDD